MPPLAGVAELDSFSHKKLVTKPNNLTYSYYLSPDFNKKQKNPQVPTLVFIHGYPDDAYMWAGAVPHMLKLPYPFLLVDLLGFSGSSKPTDPPNYNYKQQADSIAQILNEEGVGNNVIPIGHDWGSGTSPSIDLRTRANHFQATAQRFYLYHRQRCVGLALLSLAYQIPSAEPFNLDQANEQTTNRFGYPQWEYWNFFTAPDAPGLMLKNLDRMYEVMHGIYSSPNSEEKGRDIWMREMFCTPGAMRDYISRSGKYKDYTVELKEYAKNPELKKRFVERLARDKFDGPVCYYHTLKNNTNLEDEREHLCQDPERKKIKVPMLYIGQTGDWVCRTDLMGDAVEAGLVQREDLEEKVVEAGHWVLYEKPEEVAGLIGDWLQRKFPVK